MSDKFDVIDWMADHGHPEYRDKIRAYELNIAAMRGVEAAINRDIAEVRDDAENRYADWASD